MTVGMIEKHLYEYRTKAELKKLDLALGVCIKYLPKQLVDELSLGMLRASVGFVQYEQDKKARQEEKLIQAAANEICNQS